jgi:NAD(P)-dependent dehydrogenase (short-subunit alcohol dehydrogenase family)
MAAVELKGKVALVTGSARRVGKAIALELARQGMNLVVHHSASDREADETAAEIRSLGVDAIIVRADQSQPADVQRLFDATRAHYGRLDLLVNNASIFKAGNIVDLPFDEWQTVLGVNLTGPFLCSQQAARLMRERGEGGAIINILDLSVFHPWKTYPHHTVSKTGLKALTEVLALSLGPDIRVNAIAPGAILRDVGSTPEQWAKIGKRLPIGQTGDPEDVAQAVVFLATQPFVTGATLRVDGGEYLL